MEIESKWRQRVLYLLSCGPPLIEPVPPRRQNQDVSPLRSTNALPPPPSSSPLERICCKCGLL